MTEKKRQKEEKEFMHRLRPFARLQTAEDYEAFTTDMLCKWTAISYLHTISSMVGVLSLDEAILRKRIQELQQYRRLGLSTSADIEKYDLDLAKRVCSPILLINATFFSPYCHPRADTEGRTSKRFCIRPTAIPDWGSSIFRTRCPTCKSYIFRWRVRR
jgi:transcriptional adapter 2-alpha